MAGTPKRLPSPAMLQLAAVEELRALQALLAEARPEASVHGARRRIKRLRSLLRLIRVPVGETAFEQANTALREAADALAGTRRAEALVVAAARLEPATARSPFWRPLANAHSLSHAANTPPEAGLAAARAAIARAVQALVAADVADGDPDAAGHALLEAYAKARKRLRHALASGEAEQLHEARKYVIHHLHHLAVLDMGTKKQAARLEVLREVLGDLNDLDELAQLAEGAAATPSRAGVPIRKARARLLTQAKEAADQLFEHGAGTYARRLGLTLGS